MTVDAGVGELGDDSGGAEVDVVGMGDDDERALDLVWLEHDRQATERP